MKILLVVLMMYSCSHTQKFQVIAHRGASGHMIEHTLEAAKLAYEMGADYIEPDLVLSKDNVLVVLHDIHIDTTTNVAKVYPDKIRDDGRYYAIDFTLKELKSLTLNRRINLKTGMPRYPQRPIHKQKKLSIPSFEQFIQLIQKLNNEHQRIVKIIPEIKAPEFHLKEGKDIVALTVKLLRKYGYEENQQAVIQCFYPPTLKRLKNEFQTKIPLLQLVAENSWQESSADYSTMLTENGLKKLASYAKYLGAWIPQLVNFSDRGVEVKNTVSMAKKYGLKIFPYTYRSEEIPTAFKNSDAYVKFIYHQLGVDGIFTDYPDHFVFSDK
jgi:glycerophosphoryl diester phosphodiesterase